MSKSTTAILEAQIKDESVVMGHLTQDLENIRSANQQLEQALTERDAKIATLEAQVKMLEAKTGRPVARQDGAAVKALPKLEADPKTGRAACPLDAEHGFITPNTRGKCPKCFCVATLADSLAGRAAA